MATVSGYLRYDQARTSASSSALPGIANVPVVLQNTATNQMLAVLTDSEGKYTFTNVPDGNYKIVEAYGTPASASPGDFSAAAGGGASAAFPPVSYVSNPAPGATNLDATTPVALPVTVSGSDLTNRDILNGPVKYTPIQTILDNGVTVMPDNLITNADNGSFGSFPPGTAANTGANPDPYPNIGSNLTYAQPDSRGVTPGGGQYTIQNTLNDAVPAVSGTWWRISDHTEGDETGRMMVVNGNTPGATIFEQKVTVKPDTYYLMSSWILNMSKSSWLVNPKLGVQVLGGGGQVLYDSTLGTLIPMDPNEPEWKQIGTVINSQDNTSITVRFMSMGEETDGNDYAIDDIELHEVKFNEYSPQKSADINSVNVGGTVTYTVTLHNPGINPLTNVSVRDLVPGGLTFVPGSVTVNGASAPSANPNSGFTAPDIPGGGTMTVTFKASADFVPPANPTVNTANVSYSYSPVAGGIPSDFNKPTNNAVIPIQANADVSVTKTGAPAPAKTGEKLTYTVTVNNAGPSAARGVVLSDNVPADFTAPEYSTDGGTTWQPWSGSLTLGDVAPGSSVTVLIRGTVTAASGMMTNKASVASQTPDPNPNNNSHIAATPVNQMPMVYADLSLVKTTSQTSVKPGEKITYTLTASNAGPFAVRNATVTDRMPAGLTSPEYSTDGGAAWQPWTGTYSPVTLSSGQSLSILVRGTVSQSAAGSIVNAADITGPLPDPEPNNNGNTVVTPITNIADVSIIKKADKDAVASCAWVYYTLTVSNAGPSRADDVRVTDKIPPGLRRASYSTDGGATWQPWTGELTLGSLAAGGAAIIKIKAKLLCDEYCVILNRAEVTTSTEDTNPENNKSSAKVWVRGGCF